MSPQHPENPYPATSETNSQREGWNAFHAGKPRARHPFPPIRRDLGAGYYEGWDAAAKAHTSPSAHAETFRNAVGWQERATAAEARQRELEEALREARNQMWEAGARAVYDQWSGVEGWVPWVPGGNSLKQCDARRLVRKAFDALALLSPPTQNGAPGRPVPPHGSGP